MKPEHIEELQIFKEKLLKFTLIEIDRPQDNSLVQMTFSNSDDGKKIRRYFTSMRHCLNNLNEVFEDIL